MGNIIFLNGRTIDSKNCRGAWNDQTGIYRSDKLLVVHMLVSTHTIVPVNKKNAVMSFLPILVCFQEVFTGLIIPHISVSGRGKHIFHVISTSDGRWGHSPECSSLSPFRFRVSCYYWSKPIRLRGAEYVYLPPWLVIQRMRLRSQFSSYTRSFWLNIGGTTPLKSSISICHTYQMLALLFG